MISKSQTGPGGIGNSSNNAVWYDASRLNLVNNDKVLTCSDFSGNNNDLSQATPTSRPTFHTNVINGRPAMNFNGSSEFLSGSGFASLSGINELSIFLVASSSNLSTLSVFLTMQSNLNANALRIQRLSQFRATFPTSSGTSNLLYGIADGYQLHTHIWNANTPILRAYRNSNFISQSSSLNGSIPVNTGFALGKALNVAGGYLNGDIAEVIIFNSALNTSQRIIIENYLAAKYGLTISNDKFAFDATHGNEVAGIGQEATGDNHTVAQGTSVVRISSPSALSDGDYLMWGHDGAALSGTTSEIPAGLGGTGVKLSREWRADISNGNLGTVTISFNLTGYSLGADPAEYRLLLDDDGDFSNATVVGSPSGTSTITFTGVDLYTDGPFFTLANTNDVGECISFFTASALWTATPGSTWDCGVTPDSTKNVTIDVPNTRTVTGTQSCNDLTIDGILVINPGATLIVKGNMTINGTLTCNPGSNIIFRGTAGLQAVENTTGSAVTFNNMDINNANNVRFFGGDFACNGGITLRNGEFQNTTTLTLASDASQTGHIASIVSGSFTGAGTYTAERFMSARLADWNTVAALGISTDIEDLDNEVFMSGIPGSDGYAAGSGGGGFTSIWYYDNLADAYASPGSTAESMPLGRGYEVWLGDNLSTWSAKAWDFNGASFNLDPTSIAVNSGGGGWNLIGNPYPAFLDFGAIDAAYPSIVGSEFWYYDADSSQYNSRGPNAFLPPGQGFWVNMSATTTIDLEPATHFRSDLNNSELFKSAPREQLKVEVKGENTIFGSAIYLRKDPAAFVGMDEHDLPPLKVPDSRAVNMWMDYAGEESMLNYINTDEQHLEIPMVVESGLPGEFELAFKGLARFTDFQCMNIINETTGEQLEIAPGSTYTFNIGEDLSPVNLKLLLSKEDYEDCLAPAKLNDNSIRIFAHDKTIVSDFFLDRSAVARINVYNILGTLVYSAEETVGYSRENIDLRNAESGVYLISIEINGSISTEKVILQ